MKQVFKRVAAAVCVVFWVCSVVFPVQRAFAATMENTTNEYSGECGYNCTYTFYRGTLTISGTGAMDDFFDSPPWYRYREFIQTIIIEDGVTSVGYFAFSGCENLTEITLPDSIEVIGQSAFWKCSSLMEITIPNRVRTILGGAFENCTSLTEITLPDSVTWIGEETFRNCSSLTEMILPDSVTTLGKKAFENCTALQEVIISNGVSGIAERAFANCTSLTDVTISNGVTYIAEYAFSGCSSLAAITLPDSVIEIGNYAFQNCSSLDALTILHPECRIGGSLESEVVLSVIPQKTVIYGYTKSTASSYAAKHGNGFVALDAAGHAITFSFDMETNTLTIGGTGDMKDFVGSNDAPWVDKRNSIQNVIIEDGVTSIGDYAFFDCKNLIEITIPNSVTTIGDSAFSGCSSLSQIAIPDSVTSIGRLAFYGCSSLTEITIPNSVTSISAYTFYVCNNLAKITIENPECTIANADSIPEDTMIYGYADSTAEKFARENGREFVALDAPVLAGDLDGDGVYTMADAVMLFRLAEEDPEAHTQYPTLSLEQVDVDEDGLLTIGDVVRMLQLMSNRQILRAYTLSV